MSKLRVPLIDIILLALLFIVYKLIFKTDASPGLFLSPLCIIIVFMTGNLWISPFVSIILFSVYWAINKKIELSGLEVCAVLFAVEIGFYAVLLFGPRDEGPMILVFKTACVDLFVILFQLFAIGRLLINKHKLKPN